MAVSLRGYGGMYQQSLREREVWPGRVRLHCLNPPLDESYAIGPDLPQMTGGFGGWEATQRPRAVGMTTWNGVPPCEFELNLLLGSKSLEWSQEERIRDLIRVARGTRDHVPGIVYIDGVPSIPSDQWVIQNIEFGDCIRRKEDMHRVRQLLTISFMEWVPPEYETLRKGALARARPKTVVYTIKKGDTPAKIAKHRRGDWKDIREVNRKGVIKKANQLPRKGTPFHVGGKINVPLRNPQPKGKKKKRSGRGGR